MKALAAQALALADAEQAVRRALNAAPVIGPVRILALGKAAVPMWRAADAVLSAQLSSALVIAPAAPAVPPSAPYPLRFVVGAHPLPDTRSLQAGDAALQFVADTDPSETLLVLLSGGASALCEALPDGVALRDLQALQQTLLAGAWPISAINAIRQRVSRIKAGGLLRQCPRNARIRQLLISDVPGDDPAAIGSGPFIPQQLPLPDWQSLPAPWPTWLAAHCHKRTDEAASFATIDSAIIVSNAMVRAALAEGARAAGLPVVVNRALAGDVTQLAASLVAEIRNGPPGLYLYGGESFLHLPSTPGRGGRNQHLALLLQMQLQTSCCVLALATDGVDGNSDAAGACFDADRSTDVADQRAALRDASSYDYWRQRGGLLFTGPTGSNVADLLLCWKSMD